MAVRFFALGRRFFLDRGYWCLFVASMPLLVAFQSAMGMTVTGCHQLLVGGRRQQRHFLQEGRQVPNGLILHAALRPGWHTGSLDAVLDDPEIAGSVT